MQTDHTTPPPSGARHQHRLTARRRVNLVLSAAAAVVALALAAVVTTDTVRLPRPSGPRLAGPANALDSPRPVADGPVPPPRALTPDQPLRLWIAGDSLAGSLGPSLGDLTAATGVAQPVYDSRVSSGLTTPSFFDWQKQATREVARLQPEAVVFLIGTNDANLDPDTPDWKADYRNRVEHILSVLVGSPPRAVYWVGAPIMKDSALSSHVRDVNAIVQDVIAAHPEITYVDSYSLFSDASGSYAPSLDDGTGTRIPVRADDGVHFTPEGGDRLGAAVFKLLDARWHLLQQAVPGAAKQVIQTKGSTQVPGTSRSPGSRRQTTGTSSSPGRSTTTVTSGVSATSSPTSTSTTRATTTSSSSPASSSTTKVLTPVGP
jgi:hypothetical protein